MPAPRTKASQSSAVSHANGANPCALPWLSPFLSFLCVASLVPNASESATAQTRAAGSRNALSLSHPRAGTEEEKSARQLVQPCSLARSLGWGPHRTHCSPGASDTRSRSQSSHSAFAFLSAPIQNWPRRNAHLLRINHSRRGKDATK
jgi:hypothetical protein